MYSSLDNRLLGGLSLLGLLTPSERAARVGQPTKRHSPTLSTAYTATAPTTIQRAPDPERKVSTAAAATAA